MSKTNPENISKISERIVKVLTDNRVVKKNGEPNFSAAERMCKIKGTVIQKAVKRGGGLYDDNLDKFIGQFQVNRAWLLLGEGEPYKPEQKIDSADGKKNTDREEISILIKNLNIIGETNAYLLKRIKDLGG